MLIKTTTEYHVYREIEQIGHTFDDLLVKFELMPLCTALAVLLDKGYITKYHKYFFAERLTNETS